MKRLIISEILLLSTKEQAARKFLFHPRRTVILGGNRAGKSCLIKSIYATFGAEAPIVHPSWESADSTSLVKFELDGEKYSILKYRRIYVLYNKNGFLRSFNSITNDLTPFYSEFFDFRIKINTKYNQLITPPPQHLFSPFYIDQDRGWLESWNSFKHLDQVTKWKEPLISYYIGMYTNEYYLLKGQIDQLVIEQKEKEGELKALVSMIKNVREKISTTDFNYNIKMFQAEITELLVECEKLKKIQEKQKARLTEYFNTKMLLEAQIKIAKTALKEIKLDYEFANSQLDEGTSVECPTCGAQYENSFTERLSIAHDEDRCSELMEELIQKQKDVIARIEEETKNYNRTLQETETINHILAKKKEEIKLQDIIENEGKNNLREILFSQKKEIERSLIEGLDKIKKARKQLTDLTDKKQKEHIYKEYLTSMEFYLSQLNAANVPVHTYQKISAGIKEVGSTLPRTILAYFFTILRLINNYGTSTFFPIIIDSPNQQAQDKDNLTKIYNFTKTYQPENSQLIIGLEDTGGIDFECDVIELESDVPILQKECFSDISEEIQPLIKEYLEKTYRNDLFS